MLDRSDSMVNLVKLPFAQMCFFCNCNYSHLLFFVCPSWNEWLKLPIKYPDLPRNAQVCFTIWDVYGPRKAVPVGGTTVSLFGKHG